MVLPSVPVVLLPAACSSQEQSPLGLGLLSEPPACLCRATLNVPAHERARTHSSTHAASGKGSGGQAGPEQTLCVGDREQPRSSTLPRKPQECPRQACTGPRATSRPMTQLVLAVERLTLRG